MHDIQWRLSQCGNRDGAMGCLPLHRGGAREAVIFRSYLTGGHGLLDEHLDHLAIFRMHADHGAMSASETHGFEQGAVVEHEDAGVGHEQFEAGHAFAGNEGLHVSQRLVVDVEHDHVGAHIDTGAGSASVPIFQADQRTLPRVWLQKSMTVVVPPKAAACVPVPNVSTVRATPKSQSRWVCTSTPPGKTRRPLASCVSTFSPTTSPWPMV